MTVGPKIYAKEVFTPYNLNMLQNIEKIQFAEAARNQSRVAYSPEATKNHERQILNTLDISIRILPQLQEGLNC